MKPLTHKSLTHFNYYAFGMEMPNRKYTSSSYRYGFNGKENDNEVKGSGNQQDYGLRIYDPRIGRFFSVDPLAHSYPFNSTYAFAMNTPIIGDDMDGAELRVKTKAFVGKNIISKGSVDQALYKTSEVLLRAHNISLPKMSGALGSKDAGTMSFYYDSKSPNAKIACAVYTYYDQNGVLQNAVFGQDVVNNAHTLGMMLFNAEQLNDEKAKQLVREINVMIVSTVAFEIGGNAIAKVLARLENTAVETTEINVAANLAKSTASDVVLEETGSTIYGTIQLKNQKVFVNADIVAEGTNLKFSNANLIPMEVMEGEMTLDESYALYKNTSGQSELNTKLDAFRKIAKEKGFKTFNFEGTRATGPNAGKVQTSRTYKVDQ